MRRFGLLLAGLVAPLALVGCAGGGNEAATTTSSETITATETAKPSGPAYLLYTSDRDGDNDVYAVRADGQRSVQVTRDSANLYSDEIVLSPDGRWLYLVLSAKGPVLVSSDGLRTRALPIHVMAALKGQGCEQLGVASSFSPSGRLFAYGEDPECADHPRLRLMSSEVGQPRLLGYGEPLSFSPDERLLVALDGYVPGKDDLERLSLLEVATGRTLDTLDLSWSEDDQEVVGWSPSGKRFAFVHEGKLLIFDAGSGSIEPHTVLSDPRLSYSTGDPPNVRWLDDSQLAVDLECDPNDPSCLKQVGKEWADRVELSVVTVEGKKTVIASLGDRYSYKWSPDVTRVAYAAGRQDERIVVETRDGTGQRVVFRTKHQDFAWTPDGRLVVVYDKGSKRALALVDLEGRTREILRTRGHTNLGGWSPDGRFMSLGSDLPQTEKASADGRALGILSLPSESVIRVPIEGNVTMLGWVVGTAGPGAAKAQAPSPNVEMASENRLRSRGKILEISASGSRVAAIVDTSDRDCHHVVAWSAGSTRVVRFVKALRCDYGDDRNGNQDLVRIGLTGSRVTWIGEAFGNFSYWTFYKADMSRPAAGFHSVGSGDGEHGDEPGSPKPEHGSRRGVTMDVENGTIVLTRQSDGRTEKLRPPGGAVDAELEDAGLFYAFNTRGSMPGNLVFVPFAHLFA
jgi:Tol biopolymer transport system component